jgi:hypothetical protein
MNHIQENVLYIFQPTINRIVECFDPNDDKLESKLPEFGFEIECFQFSIFVL